MSAPKNYIGLRYGRLVVECVFGRGSEMTCVCVCDCGERVRVLRNNLVSKNAKSCGCLRREQSAINGKLREGISRVDLTGRRFGRLKVTAGTGPVCTCRCRCGEVREVRRDALLGGDTKSCGCLQRERASATARKTFTTHGKSKTRVYQIWSNIITRCENPTTPAFARYGGRGISICRKWRESFEAFAADVGKRPGPRYTIERIDNDGNYEPGNVEWALPRAQARNRRSNRVIEFRGERMLLTDWADRLGLDIRVLWNRLARGAERGLTEREVIEQSLT